MANFFFGVQGPTLDFRQDLAIQDTDAPRIMMYLASTENGFVRENDGTTRVATPEEMAANYARAIFSQLISSTVTWEKQKAAEAAAAAIAPIHPV